MTAKAKKTATKHTTEKKTGTKKATKKTTVTKKVIEKTSAPLVAKTRQLGASAPTGLVVILHGLGGSVNDFRSYAQKWSAELPSTAFLLLEARDRDWFVYPRKRRRPGEPEADFVDSVILPSIRQSIAELGEFLDTTLAANGLTDRNLVLVGCSQGAALAPYTALARSSLGAYAMIGPCPPRPALLPDSSATRVCVVTGDRDPYAPHKQIRAAFAKYAPQDAATDGVHVIKGLAHDTCREHATRGLAFLRSCGLA